MSGDSLVFEGLLYDVKELKQRVAELDERLDSIPAVATGLRKTSAERILRQHAGLFENDPVYEEIVRLGREYRESFDSPGECS